MFMSTREHQFRTLNKQEVSRAKDFGSHLLRKKCPRTTVSA